MNSSYDEDSFELKDEPEIPIDLKNEETDECVIEEFLEYEFLEDSTLNTKGNAHDELDPNKNSSDNHRPDSVTIKSDDDEKSNDSVTIKSDDDEKSNDSVTIKSDDDEKSNDRSSSQSDDEDFDESQVPKTAPTPVNIRKSSRKRQNEDFDPDYEPSHDTEHEDISKERLLKIIDGRIILKHYKRTISRSGCVFKDCDIKETALVPNIVRRKLLQEYKLYILKSSEVCSIHVRDQNWEELLLCTYNDFSTKDIEDILQLLKQASRACFDFEKIEHVPTRLIRYWMNVNKVQFERIYNSFPDLQALASPKMSLSLYLMYLQNSDVGRISLLLQVPEDKITARIKSVQAIIPCKSYDELNKMFTLEY